MNIDLNNLYLIGYSQDVKIKLTGTYTKDELENEMINYWIPYMECHNCGKSDYCKYTLPHSVNPHKKKEIKCGVAENFIKNFLDTTFKFLVDLNEKEKQSYLNAAYHLTEYIIASEFSIGRFINKEYLEYWDSYVPLLYGGTKNLIGYLNNAHREMKNIKIFNSTRSLILVEGESEEIFVKAFNNNLEILNYKGKERGSYEKLEILIKEYKELGYKIFLQADLDSNTYGESNTYKIVSKGLIDKENVFLFKDDFETSVPLKYIHKFLSENKMITDTYEKFESLINKKEGNISKQIEKIYDIPFYKTFFSHELVKYIDQYSIMKNLYQNVPFLKSEIGKFWYFINTCEYKNSKKDNIRKLEDRYIMINDKIYEIIDIPYQKRLLLKNEEGEKVSFCFEIKPNYKEFMREEFSELFI